MSCCNRKASMSKFKLWTVTVLVALGASAAGLAQSPQNSPPPNVRVANLMGYSLGRLDAPLTMIEFTDLQCPFCRQFHVTAFDQLTIKKLTTGKLRFISRDIPVEAAHPLAMRAAVAARCAGYQGKFWEMRDTVLVN